MADRKYKRLMVGWDPADPVPLIVLSCPSCGRRHRIVGLTRSHNCSCGAKFWRLGWACRVGSSAAAEIDEA